MSDMEQVSAKIEQFLQSGLEGVFTRREEGFFAKRGSTIVAIRLEPWGDEGDAMVYVEANVVSGASLSADVLRQLLEFNATSTYGAFGVTPEGMITIHHSLLASTLHEQELLPAVFEVAKIADDWDDVILDQAGGKRAVDLLREKLEPKPQPSIEPPAASAE